MPRTPFIVAPALTDRPRRGIRFSPDPGLLGGVQRQLPSHPENKIDNFRSTISPGLLCRINGPRTQGTVSASLGIAQDSVNCFGDFESLPEPVGGGQARLRPPAEPVASPTPSSRSDEPALANQFGLQQQRQTFTSNSLGLSADWLLDLVATQAYYQLSTFFSTSEHRQLISWASNVGVPLGALMAVKGGYEFSYSQTSGATSSESTGNLIWASLARQVGPIDDGRRLGHLLASVARQHPDREHLALHHLRTARAAVVVCQPRLQLPQLRCGRDLSTISTNTSASYRFAKAVISVGDIPGLQSDIHSRARTSASC